MATFPEQYAATLVNLGNAYGQRAAGNRLENVERAISCYQEALQIFTLADFPIQYATAKNNLGNAYRERLEGNRRENLEQAITCYHEVQQVYILADFPEQYATTQNNLGIAYWERIEGNRRENLEQAITCYHEALRVRTLADFPEQYARTQGNLGLAYQERIEGNRRQNLERSIACYQAALQVYSLNAFSKDFAGTQYNLGNAYRERLTGSQRENLERAIMCYRAALQVYTLADSPREYAATQHNLGLSYGDRIKGNRRENLEQAIVCYQQALQVYTLADFPEDYARTQCNLSAAYGQRLAGSRRENLEQAITCLHAALHVYTLADFPEGFARTQGNLGNAYRERLAGSRRENLEQAITCLHAALQVYTLADSPQDYATAQNNLGSVYRERLAGSRHENLEQAIACYQEALRVRTRDDFPEDYAATQNNLGSVYRERLAGNRHENLEQAIIYLRTALQVYTLADFPVQYAATQNNLGNVYWERLVGSRRENLEQAIICYQEALQVRTLADFPQDYAATHNNLGNGYRERLAGNRRENLEQAVACLHAALQVYTLADFPIEFRNTQLNLAILFSKALANEAATRNDQQGVLAAYTLAHEAYSAARQAQTELGWLESDELGKALLVGQSQALRDLYAQDAWCLWQLGRRDEALVALEAGRAQALTEAQAIAGASLDQLCPEHREAFLTGRQALAEARRTNERTGIRSARDAFLSLRQVIRRHCYLDFLPGDPTYQELLHAAGSDQGLVYLTALEGGGFALILPPVQGAAGVQHRLPSVLSLPGLTSEVVDTWLRRQDESRQISGGWHIALERVSSQLLGMWVQRQATPIEQEAFLALPLQDVGAALPETLGTLRQALERLVVSWRAEVERLSGGTPRQQEMAQVLRGRLALPLRTALEQGLLEGELDWFLQKAELDLLLSHLSKVILQPLHQELTRLGLGTSTQKIALIPCGRLGVLPLHAALVCNMQTGQEMPFQETCELTYQASARMLAASRTRITSLPEAGVWVTVGNPQPTTASGLPWAEAEADIIVHLAEQAQRPGSRAILGEEATRARIQVELATLRYQHSGAWVEFACHGHADPTDPTRCYMLLAHDERLTLADLQRERLLEGIRGFAASGCVTGLGDMVVAPDELSSFAAGILQAGAACALATFWSVSDRATFLLMLRFHQLMLGDARLAPAQALREAAKWLRQATHQDLDEIARSRLAGIRPIPGEAEDSSRDALRGVVSQEGMAMHLADEPPEYLRFSAEQALGKFRLVGAAERASERPYAHPIYWASAVIYGM